MSRIAQPGVTPPERNLKRKEKRDEDYRYRTWPYCSHRCWEHAASYPGELAASHPGVLPVKHADIARCKGTVFAGWYTLCFMWSFAC